ncbi:MAG: Trm112 family protein [Aggregatilineales bacterium]
MTDQPNDTQRITEWLELLRCPVAVHYTDKGADPGRLRLVRDVWLVCDDSGHKYPIVDHIPRMMVDIGEKYKSVREEDLPIPPPEE